MLLILLSWIYILAISIVLGIAINKLLKVFSTDNVIIIFLGFFGITIFTGFWAIFFAVNWQFHVVLLSLSAVSLKRNGLSVSSYIANLKRETKTLSGFFKAILAIISILILAKCASPPFLIDNESYYIQTIKWLNEYGYAKGLVNLHLFLGQTSGWHILQSVFNFSFVYDSFNDLSGLSLMLGNYYAIVRLNRFIANNETSKVNLIIGLFPIFNVFLFQFISAPSPDIAIYVIGLIVFHQFIKSYTKYNMSSFLTLCVLSLFLVLIKVSAIFFCLFPLALFIKHFTDAKKSKRQILAFGSLTFLLIIIKNLIITGNAIYPLTSIEALSFDWYLPKAIETYFNNYGLAYGYNVSAEVFENTSISELLKNWLLQPNLHGVFNCLMILLLVFSPLFILKNKLKKSFSIIYVVAVINLIFLLTASPQYRFFFPFILVLSLFILSNIIYKQKIIKVFISLGLVITAIPLIFSMNIMQLSDNGLHKTTNSFSFENLVKPHSNSRYTSDFETIQLENTIINTPTNIDFFWGTGDLPLPAVNKQQLEYFKTYFKVIPQQNSENLKDGFYSEKLE